MNYCYKFLLCFGIALAASAGIRAGESGDLYHVVKSSTGQTYLLASSVQGDTIYTNIYFRIGPVYEFDSLSGISTILCRVLDARIGAELKNNPARPIRYYSTVDPDQIGFHFQSNIADLDYVFHLANEKIMHPKFDEDGVEEAKTSIRTDLDSMAADEADRMETIIQKRMWGNDYKKLNPFGDHQTYTRIKPEDLNAFHFRYFLPLNNTISVVGSYPEKDVLAGLLDIFKEFKSKEFNPELINRVIEFKPVINYTQLLSASQDRSMGTVIYQNPGARQDRAASYCAFMLSQLINDPDGRIQKAMKDSGIYNLRCVYTCNNFYGTFRLSAEPSGSRFVSLFNAINKLIADVCTKEYFRDDELQKAAMKIEIGLKDFRATDPKEYMNQVCRYRFSNDENYFTALSDSINNVTVEKMRIYTNDYFTDYAGIKCLYTSAGALRSAAPDQQYYALDESVGDIKFNYDLNKTDIETDSARRDLARLIQWLRINPDMHVQINGFSDEGEFMKSYDSTVIKFIDTTTTFHKAMPDAYRKGWLRIEMMRAMKIAKALYEAGITEDRITGTSMVFTSETKEAAAANRKCTLTLEKIKPRMSLYEYHFGKKKPEKEG